MIGLRKHPSLSFHSSYSYQTLLNNTVLYTQAILEARALAELAGTKHMKEILYAALTP